MDNPLVGLLIALTFPVVVLLAVVLLARLERPMHGPGLTGHRRSPTAVPVSTSRRVGS